MTSLSSLGLSPAGVLLLASAILLVFFQILLFVFSLRKNAGARLFALARVIPGIFILAVLLDGVYRIEYLPYPRAYSSLVLFFQSLPWPAVAAAEILSLSLSVFLLARERRVSRRPSAYAVKETVDLLPIGICVGEENGSVLLSNVKMNEFSALLSPGALSDAGALWRAAEESAGARGDRIVLTRFGAAVFEKSEIALGERRLIQILAEDQAEQARKMRELEEKKTRLRDLQIRLKAYQMQAEDLVIRQELLKARATIHSQLGGVLLIGKYYFEHPEKVDAGEWIDQLRRINNYLLTDAEEPENERDAVAAALKLAEAIGVEVAPEGPLPEEKAVRALFGQALEECAANTVKHAAGDRLSVSARIDGGFFTAEFTNNGRPPEKEIAPSGGLLSLARAAEGLGGEAALQSFPVFRLTLRLPLQNPRTGA